MGEGGLGSGLGLGTTVTLVPPSSLRISADVTPIVPRLSTLLTAGALNPHRRRAVAGARGQHGAMARISVIGTSGAGKTSLARRLADRLDLAYLELDAVFHQRGWTSLPDDEFRARVEVFCAGDRWVICGKYAVVRDLIFDRADLVVCLDHNRLRQTLRVLGRTWSRGLRRTVLWNGNREPLRALWPFGDPQASIVAWTWQNVPRARVLFDQVEARFAETPEVEVVRLRGWRQIDAFVASLDAGEAAQRGRRRL